MEQSIPVYKEMRIPEFEDLVSQNSRLFVYEVAEKSFNYFW